MGLSEEYLLKESNYECFGNIRKIINLQEILISLNLSSVLLLIKLNVYGEIIFHKQAL